MELKSVNKFELNRMIHARAQEMHLMHSPAGQRAHPQLLQSAQRCFGVKSWSDMSVDQMKKMYDFLEERKRLPLRADLT